MTDDRWEFDGVISGSVGWSAFYVLLFGNHEEFAIDLKEDAPADSEEYVGRRVRVTVEVLDG